MALELTTETAASNEQLRNTALAILNDPNAVPFDHHLIVLMSADDLYHNGEESFIEDHEYDAIKLISNRINPTHVYFTGVGSDVRGGKIKLPYELGSLDQIEIGGIQEWVRKNGLEDEELVLTDKMDGTSTMIVYDDEGNKQIAYSRGNGTEGADISRHIFKIKNVPSKVSKKMVVRAEVELTETAFEELKGKVKSRSGSPYKNARNMVAGLMNSKTNPAVVYEHLTVVVYEILGSDLSKLDMLEEIENEGFQCVDYRTKFGSDLTDEFLAEYLNERRDVLDYAIDGVVIDVESAEKRAQMNPTRETLNPAYSIKYKVADADNIAIATVKSVTWNISKHGYLKPQVNIEPVELVGVTVQNATGFNAKFINDNGIGPGARIKITRSGDVIPFILEVVEKAVPQMPGSMNPDEHDWDWSWNETGVDAVLNNHHDHEEVVFQQVVDFFASVEAPHLKEGNIRKMFDYYKYESASQAILHLLNLNERMWVSIIGSNGKKIVDGLHKKFTNMPLHVLMGSLPFFGRGVGKRKFKKLEEKIGTEAMHMLISVPAMTIQAVEGFQKKTVDKIIAGLDDYYDFYRGLPDYYSVAVMKDKSDGKLTGKKICMTGFRDKDLAIDIEEEGGTNQSGVSSNTDILVVKDPNSNSGKAKKARDLGVQIMGVDEFKEFLYE